MTPHWTTLQSRWAAELIPDAPVGRVLDLAPAVLHLGLVAITLANRPLLCVDDDPEARQSTMIDADLAGLAGDVEVRGSRVASQECHETFAVVIADPDVPPVADDSTATLDLARACLATAADHVTDGGHVLIRLGSLERVHHVSETTDLTLVEVRAGERGLVARFDR
ncbi:hypothetical protein NPS01_14580 [Nocardioides psychrotolerans]|uniref:Methyltransferase small domain-containing protein n=1 Tax=Nocardioides psychrotolerans TaxID=1005945 RepID=A0A1I3F9G7_9ACTN|nr:methyltransferase [Nocardioides psychrotolerans]GEP37795.1 hypothetical protein NPS01_14580 [Nocardioides psychrotolerans]SFI07852.1 hypothetical protein SAMN05216561_104284 [Nocardioides psychrotolerans]